MKNVRVLDCTLRDGGRIIDCAFPDGEIREISKRLADAKIDIIEVGFLRDWRKVDFKGNSTFFTDVNQITPYLDKSNTNAMFVAFIDYGMFDFSSLKEYDGKSIDGIRFGFTKKDYIEHYDDVLNCARIIKDKGYKLFIQGVNSLNYSDKEILELIDMINIIQPYSFGIVDTYGTMYIDDVDRLYGLIDRNMNPDICINFHSHNNYQLSFGFAQEVIKLSRGTPRQIIIDATLSGMGKVARNLNTELLVDFLVRKLHYDYEFDTILDIIDDYIYKYAQQYKWGYSIPAMMARIYKSHPNNIIYLTEKFRLETKDIGKLLSMISPDKRQRYDYDNIERLYIEYVSTKVDDTDVVRKLKSQFSGSPILIMAPGNSLNTHRAVIDNYVKEHKPIIISVNFYTKDYEDSYAFFANAKRYSLTNKKKRNHKVIVASNIKPSRNEDIVVDYNKLINRGYKYFENSTMMLLNLLKRVGVSRIAIAGFDGFTIDSDSNFMDDSFDNKRHAGEYSVMNIEISSMLNTYIETVSEHCNVSFLTPSEYTTKTKLK